MEAQPPHVVLARKIAQLLDETVQPNEEAILGRQLALNVLAAKIVMLVHEHGAKP